RAMPPADAAAEPEGSPELESARPNRDLPADDPLAPPAAAAEDADAPPAPEPDDPAAARPAATDRPEAEMPERRAEPRRPTADKSDELTTPGELTRPDGGEATPQVPEATPARANVEQEGFGRYTSKHEVLLRYDADVGDWKRLPANSPLVKGDRLLSLP